MHLLNKLIQLRPYLYHFTARENTEYLRSHRSLLSTNQLLSQTEGGAKPARRAARLTARVSGAEVVIRDQAPLYPANIELTGDWSFENLLHSLDSRVFFWPGAEQGPIDYGRRHFQRYETEQPLVLRLPFENLLRENPKRVPYLCKFNSGSPRYVNGRASPRGPDTFMPPNEFSHRPSEVVEITFLDSVKLPKSTECSGHFEGPWNRFFG